MTKRKEPNPEDLWRECSHEKRENCFFFHKVAKKCVRVKERSPGQKGRPKAAPCKWRSAY
jgi:hypothetical protein